ncbi:ATP-binding cassette domain-containing protein [Enterococcus asini]|uniref:ATP-binding cassette domain-containing protein n=1 Tax=Enterococcus asini TaxID=57732 RepID=UPI0028914F40|nr:ATP-binding cassette domain-containing protein [Enterococcus asini]MDT2758051.1 ATP-binding cassette domain-containing protein [Enterococcus asini]
MENRNIIEIEKLNKKFRDKVLFQNFDLSIQKNSFTTIFGKSGSGKSTLLNIMGVIEPADSGILKFDGEDFPYCNSKGAMNIRRTEISYLFQNFGLIEDATVRRNLEIGLEYSDISKKNRTMAMLAILEEMNLKIRLNDRVYNLSGGEQQRVALARAVLKPSKIIFADEPTGSIDEENSRFIINYLKELTINGKTVIAASHDHNFEEVSDCIVNLDGST